MASLPRPAVLSCHTDESSGVTARYGSLTDHFGAVLRKLDIPPKQVEDWWSCGHTLVSLVLSGERPLTDEKIAKCPAHVQAALATEWCRALGILTGSRAAAVGALEAARHLLALDDVPLRMAKASIESEEQPALTKRRPA
jgi:hypothetical protein